MRLFLGEGQNGQNAGRTEGNRCSSNGGINSELNTRSLHGTINQVKMFQQEMGAKLQTPIKIVTHLCLLILAMIGLSGCSGVNKPLIDPKLATYDSRIIGNWDSASNGKIQHFTITRCTDPEAPSGLMVLAEGTFESAKGLAVKGASPDETQRNLTHRLPFVVCSVEGQSGQRDFASFLQDYLQVPGQPKPTSLVERQSLVFAYMLKDNQILVSGLNHKSAEKLMADKTILGEGLNPEESVTLDKESLITYLSKNSSNTLFPQSGEDVMVLKRTASATVPESLPMTVGPGGKVENPKSGKLPLVLLTGVTGMFVILGFIYASKRNRSLLNR